LFEKYLQLGRDATSSGDRVTAEAYFQHAEHYFRILNAMNQAAQQNQGAPQQGGHRRPYQNGEGGQVGEGGPSGEETMVPINLSEPEDLTPAGLGEQPEARDIPIAALPPEA
jgi:hypothetical protein